MAYPGHGEEGWYELNGGYRTARFGATRYNSLTSKLLKYS